METNQKQQYQLGEEPQNAALTPDDTMDEVAPGVPVVRTNTPRPLSFEAMLSQSGHLRAMQSNEPFQLPNFPSMAPSAPPLPEEVSEQEDEQEKTVPISLSAQQKASSEEVRDFIWLFEYGLEMDPAMLNSPDRLDGLALLYGPAVLKNHALKVGSHLLETRDGDTQTIVTIVPDSTPGAEVWGVLYRVPRRLIEPAGQHAAVLDTIHAATQPQSFFQKFQVSVRELHRNRDIVCLAYAIPEAVRTQLMLVPPAQASDTLFVQRLAALIRKQQAFDQNLARHEPQVRTTYTGEYNGGRSPQVTATHMESQTDPLPAVKEKPVAPTVSTTLPETPLATAVTVPAPVASPASARQSRLLLAFAIYLVVVLILTLTFAILQGLGYGNNVLTDTFTPLGVPWLVMMFGLLGGCLSSIACLAHYRSLNPPRFVVITWFTRPFIGAVLACLSYLLLTSGIFVIGPPDGQHMTAYLLIAAIAGLCEGALFFRY